MASLSIDAVSFSLSVKLATLFFNSRITLSAVFFPTPETLVRMEESSFNIAVRIVLESAMERMPMAALGPIPEMEIKSSNISFSSISKKPYKASASSRT